MAVGDPLFHEHLQTERDDHFEYPSLAHSSVTSSDPHQNPGFIALSRFNILDILQLFMSRHNLADQQKAGLAAIKDQKWTDVLCPRRTTIRSLYLGKTPVCLRSWNDEAPMLSKQVKSTDACEQGQKLILRLRMRFIPPWTLK
ncbi:hypothetical protein BT69DRAFT_1277215 [Atractiella rhizophila]|nr:hypothetical protein BT69DRAFT_1277215 [Atractiella rhizophila]